MFCSLQNGGLQNSKVIGGSSRGMEAWFARFKCFSGDESPGEVTNNRKEHTEKQERVAEMITYQLMQVLSGQTKPKAHMSAGLHGLIRDVVNASYDNGATSFQQQQLQAILLKTWTTLIARREVICNTLPME